MAPQTSNAPFLDATECFGQGYKIPQFSTAPFLQVGFGFGQSAVVGTPVEGLVVKAPNGAPLAKATDRKFLDELAGGAGDWRLTLPNSDPTMPDYGDTLAFELDGAHVFSGIVKQKTIKTHDRQDEAGALTQLFGPGLLAKTKRGLIRPSRGRRAVPIELTRTWSWVAFDFPDADWPRAKRIRRVDIPHPYAPYRSLPEWWADTVAYWVAPDLPSVTGSDAPLGDSLYRWTFTLDDDGDIDIFTGLNNKGAVWFDGARIGDVENAPPTGNRLRIEGATAGTHVVAARVTNFIRDTGFVGAVWTINDDGLLDELISTTDSDNVRCIGYPTTLPGYTPGHLIRLIVEEIQDLYGELLDLVLDFTDHVDSAGRTWTPVVEVTEDVERSLFELLQGISSWLVDVQMTPGGKLRMWDWGTRGRTAGVSILSTPDATTSGVEELVHDGLGTRSNHFDIRFKYGVTTYTDPDLGEDDEIIPEFLDLADTDDEATAQAIGARLMENRKQPSYSRTLTLTRHAAQPYDAFDNGDYVIHDDEAGGTESSRVLSIEVRDSGDTLAKVVALNDVRAEVEERQENWLQRRAHGSLAGGARVTGRGGEPIGSVTRVIAKDVAVLAFQDPVDGAITAKYQATASGNLIEFNVEVSTTDDVATTSETVVRLWLNGVSLGTVTIPAGETQAQLDLGATKTYRNVDSYRMEAVTVGGGVNGISGQARAI